MTSCLSHDKSQNYFYALIISKGYLCLRGFHFAAVSLAHKQPKISAEKSYVFDRQYHEKRNEMGPKRIKKKKKTRRKIKREKYHNLKIAKRLPIVVRALIKLKIGFIVYPLKR